MNWTFFEDRFYIMDLETGAFLQKSQRDKFSLTFYFYNKGCILFHLLVPQLHITRSSINAIGKTSQHYHFKYSPSNKPTHSSDGLSALSLEKANDNLNSFPKLSEKYTSITC